MAAPDLDTSLSFCTYCPKLCRHTCPVGLAEARETLTPRDKMATMRRLRMHPSERTVEQVEPLWGCTGCGACTDFCLHGVEVGRSLFVGRNEAERAGAGHPALRGFVARHASHARKAAEQIRAEIAPARRPAEAQVAFLPGCDAVDLAGTMLELCDRLGAEYVAIAETEHHCGGYPLLAAGQHDAFRLHAERVARDLKGYARLVVHCPGCAWAMKTQYRAFGVPLRPTIEHTSELLASFAERLPVQRRIDNAFYHDACYLGRHQGLYDPPRRLASKAVSDLREFSRSRNESECSGGGGLLPLTMPDASDRIADHRLAEVREAGLSTVITSCASCKERLGRGTIRAVDLITLLAEATRPEQS